MKIKRVLGVLIIACLVVFLTPMMISAEETVIASGTCGENVEWMLTDDGTLTISGEGEMILDDGQGWDTVDDNICAVVIENGVTNIGEFAFYGCSNMTSVTIPESVTSIGESAFDGCSSLPSITIPASVTSIGDYAFFACEDLEVITFCGDAPELGQYIFAGDSTWGDFMGTYAVYATAYIPVNNSTWTAQILQNYGGLIKWVTYGDNDTDDILIWGCCGDDLEWEITMDGTLIISGSGDMYDYPMEYPGWYRQTEHFGEVIIEEGVTSIGDYAFYDCWGIDSITVPESVTEIGEEAFYKCKRLEKVFFLGDAPAIASTAFIDCDVTCYYRQNNETWNEMIAQNYDYGIVDWVAYGAGSVIASGNCCGSGDYVYWVLTEDGTLTISGEGGMGDYDIIVPPWQDYAEQVVNIVIYDGVTDINNCAFADCINLESITIPDSVTYLGAFFLPNSEKITSFTIPSGVSSIHSGAFAYCTNLAEIIVDENNPYFSVDEHGVLYNKEKTVLVRAALNSISGIYRIPEGVTTIDRSAFFGCDQLNAVTIPTSVTSIGWHSFADCDGLIIQFRGDAPSFDEHTFMYSDLTVYYYASNKTWTEEVMQDYDGTVTWLSYEAYEVLDGEDSTWTIGDEEELSVRVDGEIEEFVDVMINGEIVDPENYTVSEGSTIVTLSPEYLDSLDVGEYTLAFLFENGEAETTLTVAANNPTEEDSNQTEEEKPTDTEKPTETEPAEPEETSPSEIPENPKTADSFTILPLILLFSFVCILLTSKKLRKC